MNSFRLTWDQWFGLDEETYADKKARAIAASMEAVRPYTGDFSSYVTYTDGFTPRTVKRYTDHLRGLVYGSPHKKKDGRTDLDNLFVCGTDQGMVGVIGAMLSGIAVANAYGVR